MSDPVQHSTTRCSSVKEDWQAWLPELKSKVFLDYVHQLEVSYFMFSVALNDAIELRQIGRLAKSCEVVCLTPALCARLAHPLAALLRSLAEHAKHYGTVPNASPLDPANFHGLKGQRSARMSGLLSHVLLSHRSQFLHKISTLQEMVEDLNREFGDSARDLGTGISDQSTNAWLSVDHVHFDMNTCLRETVILLKSFMLALSDDQIVAFQKTVRTQMKATTLDAPSQARVVRNRRIVQLAGE